jgi:hypothetical protein
MQPHGSETNGVSWGDGHIPYNILKTVIDEAVASYPHLYCFGLEKSKFINNFLGQPVHNLEDLKCPHPVTISLATLVIFRHKFPNVICATKNASSFYKWLTYHF